MQLTNEVSQTSLVFEYQYTKCTMVQVVHAVTLYVIFLTHR